MYYTYIKPYTVIPYNNIVICYIILILILSYIYSNINPITINTIIPLLYTIL